MALAFKEAKLGLADSGVVADALLITPIAKPPSPQTTYNAVIPYEPKTSTCNEVKVKRAAGQVDLNFTNTDGVNPHTIKYQIYVDGQLVVDRQTGFEIAAGSTLAKTELIYQVDPADATLSVQIYYWADTADKIRLDDHRIRAGIGAELEAKCVEIEKEYAQAVYAEFQSTGDAYTYKLKATYSGALLKTGSAELAVSQMLPYSELHLVPQADRFAYVTAISLV